MCEALVIVLRFVDEKWNLQQCVVQLMLLAKSMPGEELARQLIVCLSTELAISSAARLYAGSGISKFCICSHAKIVFPKLIDIGYFSHTIDHVGEHFNTPVLNDFIKTRSPKSCKEIIRWYTYSEKTTD